MFNMLPADMHTLVRKISDCLPIPKLTLSFKPESRQTITASEIPAHFSVPIIQPRRKSHVPSTQYLENHNLIFHRVMPAHKAPVKIQRKVDRRNAKREAERIGIKRILYEDRYQLLREGKSNEKEQLSLGKPWRRQGYGRNILRCWCSTSPLKLEAGVRCETDR